MPAVASQVIEVVYALMPGFLAAWIFFGLTARRKPSPFERTVQALIYTAIVQACVAPVRWLCTWIGSNVVAWAAWTTDVQLCWSIAVAVAVGLIFAGIANTDKLHRLVRPRLSIQTSYESEWFGAFAENDRYVVLHMAGERRLYGWPQEWPNQPDEGHFVITDAEWLDLDEGGNIVRIQLANVSSILIPAGDVEFVEFMKSPDEAQPELEK